MDFKRAPHTLHIELLSSLYAVGWGLTLFINPMGLTQKQYVVLKALTPGALAPNMFWGTLLITLGGSALIAVGRPLWDGRKFSMLGISTVCALTATSFYLTNQIMAGVVANSLFAMFCGWAFVMNSKRLSLPKGPS